jgi:Fe2+ or Zn2+ uptake regulation protein
VDNIFIDNYYYIVIITMRKVIPIPPTRTTTQQRAILDYIQKNAHHATAEEVYIHLRKSLPQLSLGTVYRNLERLSDRRLIAKVIIRNVAHFESQIAPHYHAVCLSCGAIDNIDVSPATDIEEFFSRSTDFKLTSHELVLYGLCPKCNRR